MKARTKMKVIAATAAAMIFGSAGSASAENSGWFQYPGYQSTWRCNSTGTYYIGSGLGYAYVQACVAVNAQNHSYYQALYNVSFSQGHGDVRLDVTNEQYFLFSGWWSGPNTGGVNDRTCIGSTNGTIATCFSHTQYLANGGLVRGWANALVVDGVDVWLNHPWSGPAQDSSPEVNV